MGADNHNNTFSDLVSQRYSCREYLPTSVDREVMAQVLETARLAPSACNRQPWRFVVVDEPELLAAVKRCYDRAWLESAPAVIVACGVHDEAWHRADGKDHTDVDLSIAIEHICLAATSMGLGTCWICNFEVAQLAEALNIPAGIEPIAIIPIGYPATSQVPEKKRKNMEEVVQWGRFQ